MGSNYQLLNPVLLVICIGLIAYLIYLLSLTFMGSRLRMVENVIMISVVIAAVIMLIILIRQGTKVQERLERVLRKRSSPARTVIRRELPHHILKELDKIIMGGRKEAEKVPKEEEKPAEKKEGAPKEEEKPEAEPEEKPKEAKPAKPPEEIPETVRGKLEEISRLLKEGAKLRETDIQAAKKAFLRIRDIYGSLPPEERKIIDQEITKAMKSRKKPVKKTGGEKE
jgi:rRNA-processing protein FCF1